MNRILAIACCSFALTNGAQLREERGSAEDPNALAGLFSGLMSGSGGPAGGAPSNPLQGLLGGLMGKSGSQGGATGGMDMTAMLGMATKVLEALRNSSTVFAISHALADAQIDATALTRATESNIELLTKQSFNKTEEETIKLLAEFFKKEVDLVNKTALNVIKGVKKLMKGLPGDIVAQADPYLVMLDGLMDQTGVPVQADIAALATSDRRQFCSKLAGVMDKTRGLPTFTKALHDGLPTLNSTKAMLPMASAFLGGMAMDVMPTFTRLGNQIFDAAYSIDQQFARTSELFVSAVGQELLNERLQCVSAAASRTAWRVLALAIAFLASFSSSW